MNFIQRMQLRSNPSYELFREPTVTENRLYRIGDMHFNYNGFRLIANEFAGWVIQNSMESIGFNPTQGQSD